MANQHNVVKIIECCCWCIMPGTVFFFLPGVFECTEPIVERGYNSYTCIGAQGQPVPDNALASLILNGPSSTMAYFFKGILKGDKFFWPTFAFFWCYFIPCSTGTGINLSAGLFFPGILFGSCIGYWIPLVLNLISNNLLDYDHMVG